MDKHAHIAARIAALVLFVSLSACEAERWNTAPANTPHLVAGVRSDFAKRWTELMSDPSAAAARTRASVIAWALREDPELLAMLQARESLSAVVAHGTADATRATEAFPQEADAWLTLAEIRRSAGDRAGAESAACRAYDIDKKSVDAWSICREKAPTAETARWNNADRARAKMLAGADLHVALRAAEAQVPRVCTRSATDMSWAELVVCGDDDARNARPSAARNRYRAAALTTPSSEGIFLALQRLEELDGTCSEVLALLPAARRAEYARWKTSLGAMIRPPLRAR